MILLYLARGEAKRIFPTSRKQQRRTVEKCSY
jgi:hypothetical protein